MRGDGKEWITINNSLETMLKQQNTGVMLLRAGKNISCNFINKTGAQLLLITSDSQSRGFNEIFSALKERDFAALEDLIYRSADIFCCDELYCRRKDHIWLQLRSLPISKKSGEYVIILLTFTETKGEEKELRVRLKEKRHDLIYNASRPITFEVDVIAKTLTLSDQFRLLFESQAPILHSNDEIITSCGCVAEKDITLYRGMYREMNEGTSEGSMRVHLKCRLTGTFLTVTILWKNIFDMHGKPIRAVGVVQPVGRRSKGSNAAVISNLQLRLELQDSYLKHVSEYLKELRHYRHDSSNNVIALKAYLAHGDTKSALEYLNRLGNNLKSEVPIIDTGNPAIDAIITEKLSVAKRKGISITQTVGIQPGLRIDMMDLTIAVASCMDNAIEACSKVISSGDSAYIELKFVEQRGALVFKLRNSSPLQVVSDKGLPETTKGDKANHGFGLRNVQRIVKKYGGQLYLKPGLSEFTTSFALILS
jgi:hypothetical protein